MVDASMHSLVNNIKMANILTPLLEAVEINKRTEGVKDLCASDMLKEVIQTGTEIYQKLAKKHHGAESFPLLGDQIFLLLSMCMRNTTVLYNSASLKIIKDDVFKLIDENQHVLSASLSDNDSHDTALPSAELGVSALANLFIPAWLFHSNIFTSGLISLEQLNELNATVCTFLSKTIERVHNLSDGNMPTQIRSHLYYVCAEVASKIMVDYQIKLLKSKPVMMKYIEDPLPVMENIVPVIHSAWSVLNEVTTQSMKSLTGKA